MCTWDVWEVFTKEAGSLEIHHNITKQNLLSSWIRSGIRCWKMGRQPNLL
jgi:hypothetical protein